jgi:peptidoglycan/LPS O-acetylase OafA/YrhL
LQGLSFRATGQEGNAGSCRYDQSRSKENDTSLTLDLLRAVAAQMVCVGPAIIFFVSGSRPQWLPVMQNIGVLFFFLISGFVIAATLSRRSGDPDYGFLRFFVDRFARIYSGLLPALVLILAVGCMPASGQD